MREYATKENEMKNNCNENRKTEEEMHDYSQMMNDIAPVTLGVILKPGSVNSSGHLSEMARTT